MRFMVQAKASAISEAGVMPSAHELAEMGGDGDEESMADRSRRPKNSPHAIEPWVVDAIVSARPSCTNGSVSSGPTEVTGYSTSVR